MPSFVDYICPNWAPKRGGKGRNKKRAKMSRESRRRNRAR